MDIFHKKEVVEKKMNYDLEIKNLTEKYNQLNSLVIDLNKKLTKIINRMDKFDKMKDLSKDDIQKPPIVGTFN